MGNMVSSVIYTPRPIPPAAANKKSRQTPRALLLVQPHPNSVSSIALVPLPQTYALGNAQHFL